MSRKHRIFRYDEPQTVYTHHNPLEDILIWISGLNSRGHVSDLLQERHNLHRSTYLNRATQLISIFANNAIGLMDQGFSGPADVSFLPLYYAILNLSKIYIIAAGRMNDLKFHRRHGVSYDPRGISSRDLLNEEITLWEKGVFRLLYEIITGESWRWKKKIINLRGIYPFIQDISHEYRLAYDRESLLEFIVVEMNDVPPTGIYQFTANLPDISDIPNFTSRRHLKVLKGTFTQSIQDKPYVFQSPPFSSLTFDDALHIQPHPIRRCLLMDGTGYDINGFKRFVTRTPVSSGHLLLPEELPIWLAFFHLSSFVRYKPDFLDTIKDSSAWPLVLTLRKHATYRFLTLFWSFLEQRTTFLSVD